MMLLSIPVEFIWLTVGLVMVMAGFLATSAVPGPCVGERRRWGTGGRGAARCRLAVATRFATKEDLIHRRKSDCDGPSVTDPNQNPI
jgi:hypothetical protein